MKRILVPCDFSKQSRAGYKTAMKWAAQSGGEVILLHVIAIPIAYAGYPQYLEVWEKEAKEEFAKMKKDVNAPGVSSQLELQYGEVLVSIKNFIASYGIDMIIMGTTGSSGASEVLIGSNTEKVVRHSSVPVLAVREYIDISSIKKILLPTLLNLDQTDFIKKLKELQSFLGASVHVLLINRPGHFVPDSEAKEAFDEFSRQYKIEKCQFHFRSYRTEEEGISDFASSEKMDLIAMATHARKGLAHLFNGSITEDVVNHVTSPIWTYVMKGN